MRALGRWGKVNYRLSIRARILEHTKVSHSFITTKLAVRISSIVITANGSLLSYRYISILNNGRPHNTVTTP